MYKFIILLLLLLIGGFGIYALSKSYSPIPAISITPTSMPTNGASPSATVVPINSLNYIDTVDWPPQVATKSEAYSCTEAGTLSMPAGKTEERTIGGKKYCVTEELEGAAGSVYHQYAYKTASAPNEVKIATFSIKMVQCGNYEEPQRKECDNEQSNFDIDKSVESQLSAM